MLWFILAGAIVILITLKVINMSNHWKNNGVENYTGWPILGFMGPFVFKKKSFIGVTQELYNKFPNSRYVGTLQLLRQNIFLRDVDLINKLTVKDIDYFIDRVSIISEDLDPIMGKNLSALNGQEWRDGRAVLSPAFTSSKMKAMFQLISECAQEFTDHFDKQKFDLKTYEMKDIFARFTNDSIASVAFGFKCNSLDERENKFYLTAQEAFNFTGIKTIKFILAMLCPSILAFLRIRIIDVRITNFFHNIICDTIEFRRKNNVFRPDMIQLLMAAQDSQLTHEGDTDENETDGFAIVKEKVDKRKIYSNLTNTDITGRAFEFFLAGFDTTSTLMALIAYELAVNPDIQEKLLVEIDDVYDICEGKIKYEKLLTMKYLDMIVSETLRKWPPGFLLDRVCTKDYTITPEKPNEVPCHIKKGDGILVPVYCIHHDPKFYPNPEKFDPERFSQENRHNIKPHSYLPFGIGPRSCIASRLVLLESKLVMFHLLSKFEFTVVKETEVPLQIGVESFTLLPDNGFWLGLKRRDRNL